VLQNINRTEVYFDIKHDLLIVITKILHGKEKKISTNSTINYYSIYNY